ncbi:MAG: HlyD family efflux transporter periplasmic adaptor subunit [Betaproteobacteria bacterium]|nr:MAG: HlyD family efflux transporter periplasmic adaptor subunit [Betaproteobacteria bacterium]
MRRIVAFALYQPLFILLGLAVFVGGGLWAFNNLPVEAFPDVTDTQATVIALYPGRAAEEVEKQVTVPLEVALSGLPGAVRMFSHTQFGLSFIIVTFNDSVNGYFARQQAIERLQGLDLLYRYRMRGAGQGPRELRTYQDWVVTRQLRLVPGVADVVSLGGLVKQYEVRPDLARLRDYKITLAQLSQAIQRGNANAGGSYVEQGRQQYLIRGIGLFQGTEDIENVVVAERGGTPILVKNVAKVAVGSVPRQGVAGQDDDDDVVTGVVLMRRGENPSEVLKLVRAKVDQLNQTGLPGGVKVVPIYDRTWLIGKTLTTVFTNLTEGALLVSFVLWLFLGNVRAAFIVAVTIPLALKSPIAGVVVERNLNPGQEIRPDNQGDKALFVVSDPTRLWFLLDVAEKDIALVKPGTDLSLATTSLGDQRVKGRILHVADVVDPQTRSVKVRGTVEASDERLKAEMYIVAELRVPAPGGYLVPARAPTRRTPITSSTTRRARTRSSRRPSRWGGRRCSRC